MRLRCSSLVVARREFYDWLRQSLGEAAAAGLYTESVRQSVGFGKSVDLGLSVCKLVLRVSHRESVC